MSKFSEQRLVLAFSSVLLITACSFDSGPLRTIRDAEMLDCSLSDSAVLDQTVVNQDHKSRDGRNNDLPGLDSATRDAAGSDLPHRDQQLPDQQIPDQQVPDQLLPDQLLPDSSPPLNCDDVYSNTPGYLPCGQTSSSCTFYFNISSSRSCNEICNNHGASCLDAWFDASDGCETNGDSTCDHKHNDAVCRCSR